MALATGVLDNLLPGILEFLSDTDALAAAAVCLAWREPSRTEQVWIPCCRRRWRFGELLGAPTAAAPGARDQASLEHWQRATEQQSDTACAEAFKFYSARCKQDVEIRSWLGQISQGDMQHDLAEKILQRGADALDILLRLERSRSGIQRHAQVLRQKISDDWASNKWIQLLRQPQQAAILEEGALVLSQWARPDADVAGIRASLEQLAARARQLGAIRASWSSTAERPNPTRAEAEVMIAALNRTLFTEFGLKGNTHDYYNDENSLLHAVLATKKGIPISLSVVWAAVARRCDLPCHPLAGFPGHVLIRVPVQANSDESIAEAKDLYIDAFDSGKVLSWTDLRAFLGQRGGQAWPEEAMRSFVNILPPSQLYMRMMRNLMGIYQQRGDRDRLQGIAKQLNQMDRQAGY